MTAEYSCDTLLAAGSNRDAEFETDLAVGRPIELHPAAPTVELVDGLRDLCLSHLQLWI